MGGREKWKGVSKGGGVEERWKGGEVRQEGQLWP